MKIKSFAGKTMEGPYLQINEDGFDIDINQGIFCVLDGFGGSGIGDKATELVKSDFLSLYSKIGGDLEATMPFFYDSKYLPEGNALINSVNFCQKNIWERNLKVPNKFRAGVSGIFGSISEGIITIVSIGNCRAYIHKKGKSNKVFVEESLQSESGDLDGLSLPTNGLGLFEKVHFQIKELKLEERDLVFILSDGIYSKLSDEELQSFLNDSNLDFGQKIDELSKLSNQRGNEDNQTALFIQF